MPTFLEDFALLINNKQDYLKDRILKGKLNRLESDFRRYLFAHWVFLKKISEFCASPSEFNVLAVDSSVYTNLLSNGGIFYIVRSLAIQKDVVGKKMECDVIFSRDRMSRIREFITTKMEMLEFKVALEVLRAGFDGM
jgi:hypothetical protein